MKPAHLRIARPTDRLDEVVRFYRDGLGFEVFGDLGVPPVGSFNP